MAYPKYAQSKGGRSQADNIYRCPKCEMYGQGNKMVYHMETCDGTGLKNYWSKQKNKALKILLGNIFFVAFSLYL